MALKDQPSIELDLSWKSPVKKKKMLGSAKTKIILVNLF